MTAQQQLKKRILQRAVTMGLVSIDRATLDNNGAHIDALFDLHSQDHQLQDAINEIRYGVEHTNLPDRTPYMRGLDNYEKQSVAALMDDGTWVGWTYWYGGGKFAEPSAIPWLEYAYLVTMEEKDVIVKQRTFTVIE